MPTDTLPFSFSFSPREEDSCACSFFSSFSFLFGKIAAWNDYRFATLALLELELGKNARGTKSRRWDVPISSSDRKLFTQEGRDQGKSQGRGRWTDSKWSIKFGNLGNTV